MHCEWAMGRGNGIGNANLRWEESMGIVSGNKKAMRMGTGDVKCEWAFGVCDVNRHQEYRQWE
eukprot:1378402-Amorphochlora_amoeboformis.AAC.1